MSDQYAVPNKLPAKATSMLFHRRKRILTEKGVKDQRRNQRIARFKKNKRNFVRAEAFIMSYIKAERTANRRKQLILRKNILETTKTNEKLLVVMRHAGLKIHDETTNKIFSTLRMPQRNACVFLKNSKENQILLKVIEPYTIYGYPNITTIRELIFKKGFAKIHGKKTPIQSNTMVEEQLSEHGIICVEDIIHEIFTVGKNFDIVNNFISSFAMKPPRDGYGGKVKKSFETGGEYGNRKNAVNEFLARCM